MEKKRFKTHTEAEWGWNPPAVIVKVNKANQIGKLIGKMVISAQVLKTLVGDGEVAISIERPEVDWEDGDDVLSIPDDCRIVAWSDGSVYIRGKLDSGDECCTQNISKELKLV